MDARGATRPRGPWRDVVFALAFLSAVVRALVPQGFTLAAAGGELSIVICSVDGARTIGMPAPNGVTGDPLQAMHAPCAFAALGMATPPPHAPIVLAADASPIALAPPRSMRPGAAARRTGPPPPRGPPSIPA